ncbi:cobalt-precorrin-5B (C(1))-methyltransferase [Leptolyngbya sp. 'hensonii']|uniref:cobalt-precorrin-5B (C(1))-methyltransferase CbiD n=1 Tax=Leptolyngbya sp. 'hensonii' TaxID=1922337 RepID=UPI00094FD2C0|nr:cobalt-precorrin-5B (C(1))-methyltransferase CbiD [Leptolyngbya sp. 'hensonii']OLP16812.1 cobalt-precorrin-5B (C(1))-methyltransferase [Leptolyngbya sp. 'hensonii']
MVRSGYTLPVFAVAAAKAALLHLQTPQESLASVLIDLPTESAEIPIQQLATLESDSALGMTLSDPGDNLDLTRNMLIWAWVKLAAWQGQPLILEGGEGLGKLPTGEAAIYSFARQLFEANLLPLIPADRSVTVRIILPQGRQLARRTSNEAFGILEGLALLGTSGISQPLSAADQLEEFRIDLQAKVKQSPNLVFCIGQNGLQVAQRLRIPESTIVQTSNWLGALLVEAGLRGARSVLLLGYQGKLIKLASGIFNTSSHLADGRLETIAAAVAQMGGDLVAVQQVLQAETADAAYQHLVQLHLAKPVFQHMAAKIQQRSEAYVKKYADTALSVGVILFDRRGEIIVRHGATLSQAPNDQP